MVGATMPRAYTWNCFWSTVQAVKVCAGMEKQGVRVDAVYRVYKHGVAGR